MSPHQERRAQKILDRSVPVLVLSPMGECWIWVARMNRNGYGRLYDSGEERMAHRVAYETFVGPIPEGMLLDHVCRTRCCVNPAHLDPVSHSINTLRGKAQLFGRDVHPHTLERLVA